MDDTPIESVSGSMGLSFLDCISCGLGAAVLLGLIFSLVGASAAVSSDAEDYILVHIQADPVRASKDRNGKDRYIQPLFKIILQHPEKSTPIVLDPGDFNPITGRPVNGPLSLSDSCGTTYLMLGFADKGAPPQMILGDSSSTNDPRPPSASWLFLIQRPCPGFWTVDLQLHALGRVYNDVKPSSLTFKHVMISVSKKGHQVPRPAEDLTVNQRITLVDNLEIKSVAPIAVGPTH